MEQDNLAWLLIDQLQRHLTFEFPQLRIEYFDRPGIQLVNEMAGKKGLILVDALLSDEPGDVYLLQANDLQLQSSIFSSHGLGVAEALELSQQLNLLPESLWILGIPVIPNRNINSLNTQQLCKQLLQHIENILKLPETNTTQ